VPSEWERLCWPDRGAIDEADHVFGGLAGGRLAVGRFRITVDGRLVGSIASFVIEGDNEVTYWIDRAFWGQGIASRALALLLESVPVRPLFARAATDNVGSLKVLQKAGFAITGTEISFAKGRNMEIEETILRLDEPANTAPSDVSSGLRPTY
jgi:RimJ/RimL family protein N-acetyltransferase